MKKIKLFLRKILCLLCLFASSSIIAQTWPPPGMQGDGTSDNPWEITEPNELEALALYVNAFNGHNTIGKYYKLMNDIDLSEYTSWKPIGVQLPNNPIDNTSFKGNFNGNNKTVKNLRIRRSTENNIGLFGIVNAGIIENLAVEDCDIVGGDYYVGGLVGNNHAQINNCQVTGKVDGKRSYIGGLVGNNYGDITNCYTTCSVRNAGRIGGLIGRNEGAISNCYALGNVTGGGQYGGGDSGGLIGYNCGNVSNCHATGAVNGTSRVGGLMGSNFANVFECFATGNVNGLFSYSGGLVGDNYSADISNCYATGDVNGENRVGGLIGRTYDGNIIQCFATGNVNASGYPGYIGGLVGYSSLSSIRNCIAANPAVVATTRHTADINRIVGHGNGTYSNNYALNTMIVLNNGFPVTISDGSGKSGIGKSLDTLQNFAFYDLENNWYDNAWDIDTEANPDKIWKICDTLSLPFFQRQERSCNPFTIYATAGENGIISPFGEITVTELSDKTFAFVANEGFKVDSLLIDGVNKPELIATGNYRFRNITENHTVHVTFVPYLNITEYGQTINLSIYPNPTKGELIIDNEQSAINHIEIFDIRGYSVWEDLCNRHETNVVVNISHLPSGIYFLQTQTEIGVITKKIVKQ